MKNNIYIYYYTHTHTHRQHTHTHTQEPFIIVFCILKYERKFKQQTTNIFL